VNCVDYFTGGDKPYLITGSDDHTAKVWVYVFCFLYSSSSTQWFVFL
jgi:hypothetical protein